MNRVGQRRKGSKPFSFRSAFLFALHSYTEPSKAILANGTRRRAPLSKNARLPNEKVFFSFPPPPAPRDFTVSSVLLSAS